MGLRLQDHHEIEAIKLANGSLFFRFKVAGAFDSARFDLLGNGEKTTSLIDFETSVLEGFFKEISI
ncbi:MAG: hypothetical protein H6577_13095 [Lewinellaceae bacterium]|nr:hypothetical protein [Saprospiraceae bacterium]MCB9339060.1 hypothetical protein [Lewinellaceae bacterium]